jgi:hypothetical protein
MAYPVLIFFFMVIAVGLSVIALQKAFHVREDRELRRHPKTAQEIYVHPKVTELKRRAPH